MGEPKVTTLVIPAGMRVELYPSHMRRFMPADCKTGVKHKGVIYVSDVQMLQLTMGDSINVLDLDVFEADLLNGPLPMTTSFDR
jgi:hypothetical protein